MIRGEIVRILKEVTGEQDIQVEVPENSRFGDYSTNIAMVLGKKEGKNPNQIAKEIVSKLLSNQATKSLCEKVEAAGSGFINFWLKKEVLLESLSVAEFEKPFKGQKLMVEFAHPNTHKPFHIGHLRNITTGECLVRLLESQGAGVIRVNYQGDIGLHIAKAIWGINKLGFSDPKDIKKRAEFLGKAYVSGSSVYEDDSKVKAEINRLNKALYEGKDQKLNDIYHLTRRWSLDYFDFIYRRVYSHFDRFYFESEVAEEGKKIALKALKKGILQKSKGAIIYPGKKKGLHDRVFVTGKGVPTYEAKDLGLAKLQFKEFNPDKILHIVGPEQVEYFQVLFSALGEIFPKTKGREIHIPYGFVRLKEGKMSSRAGNVILGEWLIDEVKERIIKEYNSGDEIAEKVAIGAIKYSFLKTSLRQEISFDIKESVSLEGNSGPYLQYTVARANSVLAKIRNKLKIKNFKFQINSEELAILRSLIKFQEAVIASATSYSPNLLCNYLYDLASKFNTFYNKHRILGTTREVELFRVLLTKATGQVLKTGLSLLGIQTPERM